MNAKACTSLPLLTLACLALSSSLMADESINFYLPDLSETEVNQHLDDIIQSSYGDDLKPLEGMEVNEESIHSILQNEQAVTTVEKLNAPIIIHSMEEAAEHLNHSSMEKLDVDFDKQQLVIFAWNGSDKDKLSGYFSQSNGLEAKFHYLQGGQLFLTKASDLFDKKAKPNGQGPRTAVFFMTKHAKVSVQHMSIHSEAAAGDPVVLSQVTRP